MMVGGSPIFGKHILEKVHKGTELGRFQFKKRCGRYEAVQHCRRMVEKFIHSRKRSVYSLIALFAILIPAGRPAVTLVGYAHTRTHTSSNYKQEHLV